MLALPHWQELLLGWLALGANGKHPLHIGEQIIEWQATALPDGIWLVLGRDTTPEHNLTLALADSRTRYKELLDLSGDYMWETDRTGRFVFVSTKGLLGWSAEEVTGKRPHELGLLATDDLSTPFLTQVPVQDARLWIQNKVGKPRCLCISAIPRFDAAGAWVGARGLCHDTTEQIDAAARLAGARLRARIISHISHIMNDGPVEDREFNTVVRALTHAMSAGGAAIYRRNASKWELVASYGSQPPETAVVLCEATLGRGDALQFTSERHEWLLCRAQYQRQVNGAVMIWRHPSAIGWNREQTTLIEAVAEQFGTMWAQLTVKQQLQEKAERDSLTGLYNQGAFAAQVQDRLARGSGVGAVLVNIDLDNFKSINDHLGHAIGDDVLKRVAGILEACIRASDIPGRVGGDEFLLWLERTDQKGAQLVAQRIISEINKLSATLGKLPRHLGASIGLAPVKPGDTFASIMRQADDTMYNAKHNGKGHAELAS